MKQLLSVDTPGSYTFNPASQTVTFSGLRDDITLSNILLITNVTANTIIYNFADPTNGAVSFNNNVLTLDHNTTSMNSTDVLQIFLDLPSNEESLHDLLRRMNKILESNATVDIYQRQRVVLDGIGNSRGTPTEVGTTVPVSGTVTASFTNNYVTNAPSFANTSNNPYTHQTVTAIGLNMEGPVHQIWRIANDAQACYAQAIRSKLTFS